MLEQHIDCRAIEVFRGALVALDSDQFVDLPDADPTGHQRFADLRKVATDPCPTNLVERDM